MIRDTEDLKALLGVPYTEEQLDAITAPLEPAVIVAGAGSGKTTVMAARVVWLVGTGQVGPHQVLGLTFTNKAAAELAERIRKALRKLEDEELDDPDSGLDESVGEPTVSTYHAYADRLIKEHGLRLGLEPSARLLADATRYQLAVTAVRGPKELRYFKGKVADLADKVLALDGELSEHLVTPGGSCASTRKRSSGRPSPSATPATARPSAATPTSSRPPRSPGSGSSCPSWSSATAT